MIIFYNKKTGLIRGIIEGRLHLEDHLKMWIGDKKENSRLIIQWKPTGEKHLRIIEKVEYESVGVDENGEDIYKKIVKEEKEEYFDYEPDSSQKDLFIELDKKSASEIYNYKVDIKTGILIKNEEKHSL